METTNNTNIATQAQPIEMSPVIQTPYADITATGIKFRDDVTIEQYTEIGTELARMQRTSLLLIGDWINFGAEKKEWGEKYKEAVAKTGLEESTLRNAAWVARKVDLSLRSDKLGYKHHQIISKIKDPEQQKKWVKAAEEKHLSCRLLGKSIEAGKVITPSEEQKTREVAERERGTKNIFAAVTTLIGMISTLEESKGTADTWDANNKMMMREQFKGVAEFMRRLGFQIV